MKRLARPALFAGAALLTASGVSDLLRRRRRARGEARVFVLAYHEVTADGREREGVVSAARLRRHVAALGRRCRLVTLAEAAAALAEPGALREDLAVLTFDDGYAGNYEAAWPVLREAGVPATVFVTTGFLDGGELWFDAAHRYLTGAEVERLKRLAPRERERRLRQLRQAGPPPRSAPPPARPLPWSAVREMRAAGIEIGCHTVTHPLLAQLPRRRQEEEIHQSCARIAAETGAAPVSFAYPNGSPADFGPETVEILRAAGLRAACTTVRGANRPGCDLFRLRRIGVGSAPASALTARLSGLFDAPGPQAPGSPAAPRREE